MQKRQVMQCKQNTQCDLFDNKSENILEINSESSQKGFSFEP